MTPVHAVPPPGTARGREGGPRGPWRLPWSARGYHARLNRAAVLFLSPATLIIACVLVYPIASGIYMGFTNRTLSYEGYSFVFLDNFREMAGDPIFWKSLGNSCKLVFFTVALNTLIGFALALLLNVRARYAGLFRTLLFLPWVLPSVVVAFSFRWLYSDSYGYLNHVLARLHLIASPVNPLSRTDLVWPAVIAAAVWFSYPFVLLVFSAALRSIDGELYEAARIDGAGRWQQLRFITLPALKSTFIMVTVLQVIWEFASFDLVYLLTRGGPANTTLTLSLYVYKQAFHHKRLGYASALAVVLFLVLASFVAVYLRLARKEARDGD
ncbi:MAG: sugar ABC transporter permease [Actinomycetota bacterium]|nr:sugar ABC transporter permease [Actinomycetota bacterium]